MKVCLMPVYSDGLQNFVQVAILSWMKNTPPTQSQVSFIISSSVSKVVYFIKKKKYCLNFQCLSNTNICKQSLNSVRKITAMLSFLDIIEVNLKGEWRILQAEMISGLDEVIRIDHSWSNIITQKTDIGHL